MRRTVLISLTTLALSAGLLSTTPVRGQTPIPTREAVDQMVAQLRDERRGLVFDGLRRRPGGPCGNAFEIVEQVTNGRVRCTHGPDPAPDGVDVRVHREFPAPADAAAVATGPQVGVAAAQAGIPCYGSGSDGYRVQLLYVRQVGTTDKSATLFPNFVTWAGRVNTTYLDSAAKTAGVRNIRFVTDTGCNLVIQKVTVSSGALTNFSTFVSELKSKGFNRSDRKYLSWVDANAFCGIGEIYIDDKPTITPGLTSSNANNGHPDVKGSFARIDNGCWGQANPVEAHELTHMLGGVQTTAPNATSNYHCRDESDRMCYADAAGVTVVQRCAVSQERLLDCNGNDYFNTRPTFGSWLASHWNVANSAFLATSNPTTPPTTTATTVPATTTTAPATTTTKPPTTTTTTTAPATTTTTAPPATTTTTTRPPTTTTAPAPTPSAPVNLQVFRLSSGIWLFWSAPSTGPVTGYNVYRKSGTGSLAKIADLGSGHQPPRRLGDPRRDVHLRRLGRERLPGGTAVEPGHRDEVASQPRTTGGGRPDRGPAAAAPARSPG